MRKSVVLLCASFVMGLALLLPATAAANVGYSYTVLTNSCTHANDLTFRVRYTAAAGTPTNKMTIFFTEQYKSGGTWHVYFQYSTETFRFTDDGYNAHSRQSWINGSHGTDVIRFVATLRAWDHTLLLDQEKVASVPCNK
jgi:hypothetical protein